MKNKIKVVPLLIAVIMCAVFLSACGIVTNDNSEHAFDDAAISDVNIKFDDCGDAPTVDSIVSNDKIDNTYLDSDNSKPNKTPTLPDIVFPSAPETSPSGSNDGAANLDGTEKTDGEPNDVEVVTVEYLASAGGYIEGESTQIVKRGNLTSIVHAVAEDGYVFIKWSDEADFEEGRRDKADKSFTVTAVFAQETVVLDKLKFKLEYNRLGYSVSANDKTLTEAIIPDYINGLPVKTVAFNSCTELLYAFIPETVDTIGDRVFYNCKKLKTVKGMLGVVTLGKDAFKDCESLEKVIGMTNLKFFDASAFDGCKSLKNYILPETVEQIDITNQYDEHLSELSRLVFIRQKPDELNNVEIIKSKRISIPHAVYIGTEGKPRDEYALKDDDELFNFTLTNDGAGYSVSARDYDMTEALIPSHYNGLPVTEIADRGFMNSKVVTAYFPKTVTKIGQNAFSNCRRLIRVAGLNEVTTIGSEAFSDCLRLNEIVLPHSLEKAGANIFKNNPNAVYIRKSRAETDKLNAQWDKARPASAKTVCVGEMGMPSDVGGGMQFVLSGPEDILPNVPEFYMLYKADKNIKNAIIPAYIKGIPVKCIFVIVFSGNSALNNVFIPDTVEVIFARAFANCVNLKKIYRAKGLRLIQAGSLHSSFIGCDALAELIVTNNIEITDKTIAFS